MEKKTKIIIIALVVLALVATLILVSFRVEGPGTLIGGLAILWAGLKSRIFDTQALEEKIEQIKTNHQSKRDEWLTTKKEYDSKLRMLEAQMRYIDYKAALISEKINQLDDYQKQKIKEIEQANSDELLQLLNQRKNQ